MVAIPLEKKGNRDPFASRSLAAFARYVGHPRVIIHGDLGARTHGSHPRRVRIADSRNTTNLTCEQQGAQIQQPRRAVQSVEGMARTLRLDLLGRTNIAVGGDLPITSWMVRHAASLWLARFDACRRQDARIQIWWWPRGAHPWARRPAEAAAGDAPHRDETCGGAKTSDRGSCKLWRPTASGQRRRRQCTFKSSSKLVYAGQLRGHSHHRLQWKAATIQVERKLTVLVLVVTCAWRWHKLWNRQRNHTVQWRSTMRVSFKKKGDPRRTVGQVLRHPDT